MVCIIQFILLIGLLSGRSTNTRKYATVSFLIYLILSRCFSTLNQFCPSHTTRIFAAIQMACCPRRPTRLMLDSLLTLTRPHTALYRPWHFEFLWHGSYICGGVDSTVTTYMPSPCRLKYKYVIRNSSCASLVPNSGDPRQECGRMRMRFVAWTSCYWPSWKH